MRTRICSGKLPDGVRCPNPTSARYCPEHGDSFGARFRRTLKAPLYETRAWRRLSASFRAEWVRLHGLVCGRCGRRLARFADLHAGHRVAFADGGAELDRANLIGLCGSCNARQSLADRARR